MSDLLTRYQGERESLISKAAGITAVAAEAQRSLTPAEEDLIRSITADVDSLTAKIEPLEGLKAREAAAAQTSAFLAGFEATQAGRQADSVDAFIRSFATPGAFIAGRELARRSGDQDRIAMFTRALAHEKLASIPGLLPKPIVGPIINWLETARPVTNAFTVRDLPMKGSSFDRPIVTQHTAAGLQATEKTEFASQELVVTPLTVNKKTYGSTLNFSVQAIDWSDPSILDIAINDMIAQIALEAEKAVLAEAVLQAAKQKQVFDLTAVALPAPADLIGALAGASSKVQAGTTRLANRILVSVDVWAKLLQITATDGRGVVNFGYSQGVNNVGDSAGVGSFTMSLLGVPVTVVPNAAPNTFIVADSQSLEVYLDTTQMLRVAEPSIGGLLVGAYLYQAVVTIEPKGLVAVAK